MDILLIDDDIQSRDLLERFLRRLGHEVVACDDGEAGLAAYKAKIFPIVLCDILMPRMTGIEFLQLTTGLPRREDSSVLIMTAHANVESAIAAMKLGAYDYLSKPINLNELAAILDRTCELQALRREHRLLKENFASEVQAATQQTKQELERLKRLVEQAAGLQVGVFSDSMRGIFEQAQKYHTDRAIPVLIEGETGTGKEVVAKIIHHGAAISAAPFIDLNCAALTPSLFESELFGYEPGAFTGGLNRGQKGKIDIAAGGSLFLDEIGEISSEVQGKLLRVLAEKEFYRVGGLTKIKTDVRIICATNVGLTARVETGAFRRDLYYRLKVGHIIIPPLRERAEEIVPLAQLFLADFAHMKKKRFQGISKEAAKILSNYAWPGNVRELRNTIDWVSFMYDDDELQPKHLIKLGETGIKAPPTVPGVISFPAGGALPPESFSLETYINQIVLEVLNKCGGNKTEAAQYLKISRRALCYRLDNMETGK